MTDRHAAVELRRSLEAVWDEIRAEFALQDGFWLAFVFGAEAPEVAELVARSTDLARIEVQRVEVARFGGPDDVVPVLRTLLTPHGPDVAATWVTDAGTGAGERERAWTELLQRLNERRDRLRAARPAGLLFACPAGMLPPARDEAPDLWSFRDVATTVDARSDPPSPTRPPADEADTGPNPLRPAPGPPIRASDAVGPLLHRAANAVRTGRVDAALTTGHEALDGATTAADDATLAHAWLAQARDLQGEPVEAGRHARAALGAGRPLEEGTAVAPAPPHRRGGRGGHRGGDRGIAAAGLQPGRRAVPGRRGGPAPFRARPAGRGLHPGGEGRSAGGDRGPGTARGLDEL